MIDGKVEVKGASELLKTLNRTQVLASNLSKAWPAVGEFYSVREQAIFDKGGRPKWKPLSPHYIVQRRKEGLGGRTLVRTGLLKRSVTDARPAKSNDQMAVFGPAGRTAPHWVLHKHGTKRMPKRDPLPALTKGERSKVRDILAAYVTSAVKSGPTASASTDPMILGLREAMAAAKGRGAIT